MARAGDDSRQEKRPASEGADSRPSGPAGQGDSQPEGPERRKSVRMGTPTSPDDTQSRPSLGDLDSPGDRDRKNDPDSAPQGPAPPEPGRGPLAALAARLSALGQHKILSKIGPASWSPARRGTVGVIGAFLAVATAVVTSFIFLGPSNETSQQEEAALNVALDSAWTWVDGSEAAPLFSKPPWLEGLKVSGTNGETLARGIEEFQDFRFEEALASFKELQEGLNGETNPDHRLMSLMAATNLRLLNYGQAKADYAQALALMGTPREKGGLKEASDRLGLALALFHQQDYDNSLNEAGVSWRIRHQVLGAADPRTLASVNSMATSLMALSRSAVAGDMLLDAVAQAIEAGADQNQPVMRDSLSILFLAFEAQGRGEELKALFQPPEPVPSPSQPAEDVALAPGGPPEGAPESSAEGAASMPAPSQETGLAAQSAPSPSQPPGQQAQAESQATSQAHVPIDREEAKHLIASLKSSHPNSRVLPALALALASELTGQAQAPCRGPYPTDLFGELLPLCLDVARGYASVNELDESSAILESLSMTGLNSLAETVGLPKPRLVEALALLASERAEQKNFAAAEAALRQAREVAATMPKGDQQTLASLIILSLRLSDIFLVEGRPPIEAEMELVSGLTTIKKLFNSRDIEKHPLTPILYLRLSWLVRSMNRAKDARGYLDQASRALKAGAKAYPEYQATFDQIAQAHEETKQGKAGPDTLSNLWRAVLPSNLPAQAPASPEVMRSELAALKLLNRLPEFGPLIDSAIQWASENHGHDSPAYRRYLSLNLKYHEESGNLSALLSALDNISANPGTDQEPDRTAIVTAALRYKARALEKAGQDNEALEALTQARIMILDNPAFRNSL
ncbi:MAG: hypothetical protein LBU69_01840, partial [Deltaproteobacteria bacterium]|nr:hypothetical protein [Deltaproteobacteria bacterium]